MRALFCFLFLGLFGIASAEVLQGPNVNPSNLAVLVEWEKFTDRQADIVGDNLSAETWEVFLSAPKFREEGDHGAMALQLGRWANAFDGDGVLEDSEAASPYLGSPRGELSDYVVELAVPMFPGQMLSESGVEAESTQIADRWEMGRPSNRLHATARKAFQALAKALVDCGMENARLRLGWEFSGDWFPWGIDPNGGEAAGTAAQFKECWKFIYLTMEEVNPKFTWVWCSTVGYDHFDPGEAFPEFPEETFKDAGDNKDKILTDYVSVDVYDADGECYYRVDDDQRADFELVPGYWNTRDEDRQAAFACLQKKVFEGRGNLAAEGESKAYGLRYFQELALKKKLPLMISEWGPWANYVPKTRGGKEDLLRSRIFGGDDNPEFVDGLFQWARSNKVEAMVLFEFYNGGQGDVVDHTFLPEYWNSNREGRPRVSLYPEENPLSKVTNQLHPRAAKAYLRNLKEK